MPNSHAKQSNIDVHLISILFLEFFIIFIITSILNMLIKLSNTHDHNDRIVPLFLDRDFYGAIARATLSGNCFFFACSNNSSEKRLSIKCLITAHCYFVFVYPANFISRRTQCLLVKISI